MKHLKVGRKFGREKKQREALMKITLGNLFLKGKISTTQAKAKELKRLAEGIISKMKNPVSLRLVKTKLPRNIDQKIISDVASATSSRSSGYTRIIKQGRRRSDGAELAIIEIIKDEPKGEPARNN